MSEIETFFNAIVDNKTALITKMLENNSDLLSCKNEEGLTPFEHSINVYNIEAPEIFIRFGQKLDTWGASALGKNRILEETYKKSPEDLNKLHSVLGWAPLHVAAFHGHYDTAKLLIKLGADINILSKNNFCVEPIVGAIVTDNLPIVKLLLKNGSKTEHVIEVKGKCNSLHVSAQFGVYEISQTLLKHGVDPLMKDDRGKTPVDVAEEREYFDLAQLLKKATKK